MGIIFKVIVLLVIVLYGCGKLYLWYKRQTYVEMYMGLKERCKEE